MSQQLRGWVDYDRPHLQALNATERIDYFEKRVHLVAINPLDRILVNEIHVSPDSSALLVYGVALCCAIEATGKFLTGDSVLNRDRFYEFIHTYMDADFQLQMLGSLTYSEVLWLHFRNGLAHGFAVCHGGFEGDKGQPYFSVRTIAGQDSLMVNPFRLYEDYVDGFKCYVADLRTSQPKGKLFLQFDSVFSEVFIHGR